MPVFLKLNAKLKDGSANVVSISNRKIDVTKDSEGKEVVTPKTFLIPAERFEYPQAENWEEAYQFCGGQAQALAVFNDSLRDASVTEGKNSIRMASAGTEEDIINAGLNKTKNYTFIEQEKVSAAEAKEAFGNLRALVSEGNLSEADLLAAIKKQLGL